MQGLSQSERRNRTLLVVASGLVALILLAAWAVILRREPIEDDLTSRAAAALERAGLDGGTLRLDGRDASVAVPADLASTAESAIRSETGIRVVDVTPITTPETTTTTTTTPPTTTTAITTTTTTIPPVAEASFTLTSDASGVTLSGRLSPGDAGAIVGAAERAFGAGRVTDAIVTDSTTTSPPWTATLPDAIGSLAFVAEPGLSIDGTAITLVGDIASEERRAALIAAFGLLGLEVADGFSIAAPPAQQTAAALEQALNATLADASILFATGSSQVSDEGSTQLDAIADLLIAVPGARVEVGGHTDSEGPADGNLVLSQARADAVADYLISRGVDPVQLTAVGHGEDQPIAENTTPEGRAANRRIAFIVEGST